MRVPKDSKTIQLSRKSNNAIERVFQLLREHQDELQPPELKEAYAKYHTAIRAESKQEISKKEKHETKS